jgi:hypothetical protein
MNATICTAIQLRRVVQLSYHGGIRRVEPHCHGRGNEGHDLLRAYQLTGHSQSGQFSGWKMFRVDQMIDITLTAEQFPGPRPGYDRSDDLMREIYCQV